LPIFRAISQSKYYQKYLLAIPLIELVFSLAMLGAALPYLANFVKTMATTSLWNDELYSIVHFSGRGPFTTLTDYHVPNNHIFFNLLNSLTPGAGSFEPWRGRLWSFGAIAMLLGLILYEFFRRRHYLAGALVFQIVAVNYVQLDLDLQGRGYAILALCGVGLTFALWRYLEQPTKKWLITMLVLTVLGTWTVPTFIFFAGPLLLLLFLYQAKREIFIIGLITAGIIALLYLPVVGEVIHQSATFADSNGQEYSTVTAVFTTLKEYLFHPYVWGIKFRDGVVFALLGGLFLLPLLTPLRQENKAEIKTLRLLIGAVAIFFILCLLMETVVIRATAFVVLPMFLGYIFIASFYFYQPKLQSLRPLITVIIAVYFILHSFQQFNSFRFTPIENWLGTARYIERTFPKGTEVYITTSGAEYLSGYLSPAYPLTTTFDAKKFAEGQSVAVDARVFAKERFNPAKYSDLSTEVFIFQRWSDYQKVMVTPPSDPYILWLEADGKVLNQDTFDRNKATRWTAQSNQNGLRIYLKPGTTYRSLYILTGKEGLPANFQVQLGLQNGQVEQLKDEAIGKHLEMITLFLDNRAVEYLDLKTSPSKNFSIIELWAYPT